MSFLDLSNIKEQSFQALPPGQYPVKVETAEVKDTKTAGGQYIAVMLVVSDGEHKGRKVSHKFNIKNASPKAQEIGLSELKTMLRASGANADALESVSELTGKALNVKTALETYGDRTSAKVKAFLPLKVEAPKGFI